MKPQHWVCYTALLARVFPALCSSKKPLINSGRQCHRTGSYCPELWLAAGYSTDRSAAGEGRAEKKPGLSTTMSQTGLDYSQHNVQCLKDLGSDCDNGRMDVIVAGKRHDAKEHVVFFGGDVQVCVIRDIDFMFLCECMLVCASLHALYVCVSLSLSTLLWWRCAGMCNERHRFYVSM